MSDPISIPGKRNAVTGLVRGYGDLSGYGVLLRRNQNIRKYISPRVDPFSTDYILFHEGDIPVSHQEYINEKSGMDFLFIDLCVTPPRSGFDSKRERFNEVPEMSGFGNGYRHMCHFWFIDFVDYLSGYTYAVRIDEDCLVLDFPSVFDEMEARRLVFTSGGTIVDIPAAVVGLADFSRFYRSRQGLDYIDPPGEQSGPMTNLMGLDLSFFRSNVQFRSFCRAVSDSGMIYTHRWGDLPLWGEYLRLYVDPRRVDLSFRAFRYYHGSHKVIVNGDDNTFPGDFELRNISLGRSAVCNSRLGGFHGQPSSALSGHPSGTFSFHTDSRPEPFWEVDLGSVHLIKALRVFNRGDDCSERAVGLIVEGSLDRITYFHIHTQRQNFGGFFDSDFLFLDFRDWESKPECRFLKLRLPREDFLHLDTVDVFA